MSNGKRTSSVRVATFNDIRAITKVHISSRVSAYRETLKSVEMELHQLDDFEKRWQARLLSNTNLVYVVELNQKIVGVAAVNISDQPLMSHLYIAPDFWGKGAGTLLCNEIFSKLQKQQYQLVYVWVIKNARAELFYRKMGFSTTGCHKMLDYCGESVCILEYNKYFMCC